ncbi:hypothetical protein DY000_02034909 [Brassica cretica]|uniref:Uncharacterized protein n=1 Tax=Brassica cretica TaxID=69181 RepID=A0ABQ7DQK2_BRACR|nr:hypothetical protein DY000_02034909 [Brassica cretica]
MSVTDETTEGLFVCFDGVMTKLHSIRASEAGHLLAGEGVKPEETQAPPFVAAMEVIIHSDILEEDLNKENKQTTKNCWLLTYQKQKKMVSKLVIAGEPMGIQSLFCTPTLFLEFALDPGAQLHHDVPESWKVFAYVLESRSIFRVL